MYACMLFSGKCGYYQLLYMYVLLYKKYILLALSIALFEFDIFNYCGEIKIAKINLKIPTSYITFSIHTSFKIYL